MYPKQLNVYAEALHSILKSYVFTRIESTPYTIEVGVTPEILGNVYERIIALKKKHRQKTGTVFTPNNIVHDMVSRALHQRCLEDLSEKKRN